MKLIITFVLAFLALALCDPPIPTVPKAFIGPITVIVSSGKGVPSMMNGHVYYDVTSNSNKHLRLDMMEYSKTQKIRRELLQNENSLFTIQWKKNPTCDVQKNVDFCYLQAPQNSKYLGMRKLLGVDANVWQVTRSGIQYTFYHCAQTQDLMALKKQKVSMGNDFFSHLSIENQESMMILFLNIIEQRPKRRFFTPPSICKQYVNYIDDMETCCNEEGCQKCPMGYSMCKNGMCCNEYGQCMKMMNQMNYKKNKGMCCSDEGCQQCPMGYSMCKDGMCCNEYGQCMKGMSKMNQEMCCNGDECQKCPKDYSMCKNGMCCNEYGGCFMVTNKMESGMCCKGGECQKCPMGYSMCKNGMCCNEYGQCVNKMSKMNYNMNKGMCCSESGVCQSCPLSYSMCKKGMCCNEYGSCVKVMSKMNNCENCGVNDFFSYIF